MDNEPTPLLTRRRMLERMIAAPAAALVLAACGDSEGVTSAVSNALSPTATPLATTAPVVETATATAAATPTAAATTEATGALAWASGGTNLITVGYPDTSIFDGANTCSVSLTQGTTEGPCYFSSDTGEDIALSKTGLPMQLCLQLVDETCTPLSGYVIEVWHCDTRGIYSGDTSASADSSRFAGDFCTAGDAEAEAATYFRGQLTTDADGRVNFKTCFPGWYSGRTIHIHFAVSDPDGTSRVISQFCFTDALTEQICTTHDLYADRGVQDTTLEAGRDTVFPSGDYEDFLLTTQQNNDGSMLAYGVIQIDPTAVATQTGGPDGGPGGMPPQDGDRPTGPPPGSDQSGA